LELVDLCFDVTNERAPKRLQERQREAKEPAAAASGAGSVCR
jgi:hypothetical protein